MIPSVSRSTVQPGQEAPDFLLPLVSEDGQVALDDYRGRSPLILALLRSLWCPFCRRRVTQLAETRQKLEKAGVELLAVTEGRTEPLRKYFRVRPLRLRVAAGADPEAHIYRAYGVPMPASTQEYKELRATVRINPTGEAPEPMSLDAVQTWLREHDRFGQIPEDQLDQLRSNRPDFTNIHAGHFLIDRAGVVRWVHIETPIDNLSRYGIFPTDDELLAAVRAAGL
jgi:peroxiredoxin